MENLVIGIDLGTTYSCVSVYQNDKVIIIPNKLGNLTTPSFVSFTENEILIGEAAKNKMVSNSENTVFDSKRLIGKYFDDEQLQTSLKHFPFKVEKGENNKPLISVTYQNEQKQFYPEQISAFILKYLKKCAEEYLGTTINNAVITVPAYFNDSQRRGTVDAGAIAGLNVLRIINEPTAAALAYGLNLADKKEVNILVFDLGGGTFDLSILTLSDGLFQVKATFGDTFLGGEDMDHALVLYCLKEFKTQNPSINTEKLVTNKKTLSKLKSACENAKKMLSSTNTTQIDIDSLYDGIDFTTTLSRAKFESLCEPHFNKCMELVKEILKNANMKNEDINDVVLIGGSTRIPKIREMLKVYFGKDPKISINPDEAVAYGAAIQGAILSETGNEQINALTLIDCTALSVGIETSGGLMSKIIERGTSIPCSKSQVFSTYSDNQQTVVIKVFEGERELTQYNNLLATFSLDGLAPRLRGIPKINVKFEIDANGVLSVSAYDESVNKIEKIVISNDKNKFSPEQLLQMIEESKQFSEADKLFKERLCALTDLENYIYNTRNIVSSEEMKNKVSDEDCKIINLMVNELIMWTDDNRNETIEVFKTKLTELKDLVSPIFIKAYEQKK